MTELGAHAVRAALERAGISGDEWDEVVLGCVLQAGLGQNPARQSAIAAGIPQEVPSTTINMLYPRLNAPLSAVLVTGVRSAIAACGLAPGDVLIARLPTTHHSVVENDLRTLLMLAAKYLLGVSDLQAAWEPHWTGAGSASWSTADAATDLAEPPAHVVDRAVITIGRYAPLGRGEFLEPTTRYLEMVSVETLALVAYFGSSASRPTSWAGLESCRRPRRALSSRRQRSSGARSRSGAATSAWSTA